MSNPMPQAKPAASRRSTKPHEPTKQMRQDVAMLAAVGTNQDVIAGEMGISIDTLARKYRDELDNGKARANAKVAVSLFNKAITGDNGCMFFWLKCQAGWRDVTRHEHSGPDGKPIELIDLSRLTDEELDAIGKAAAILSGSVAPPDSE